MKEYILASEYAKITYVHRDILSIMSRKEKKKTGLDLDIEHPGIENWIAEQYEKERLSRK